MRVEKHFPDAHGYHKALDEAAGRFSDVAGKLVVTEPPGSSDLLLDVTGPNGNREHDALQMWDQMGLTPEQMVPVLQEKIARMLAA